MNDKTTQMSIESLCKSWQDLKCSLYECDDIRMETFCEVFKNTEQLLSHCITANAVGKEYIPLVADVYGFVDAPAGDDNIQTQAAKILTERMMYQYVVNEDVDAQNASCVTVYLLKAKRQLKVDFSNVELALSILVEAMR